LKKSNLQTFDGEKLFSSPHATVDADHYLKKLAVHRVTVHPLRQQALNAEKGVDTVLVILDGQGSINIHDKPVPIKQGDVVLVNPTEKYTLQNDSLSDPLVALVVLPRA
jgi:mannose-6-phosphate isomerase-like protein (cupin superfamily)